MDELGRVLVSLADSVPDGLVVFFCSYDHLQKTYKHFEQTSLLNQLDKKKKVRLSFVQNEKSFFFFMKIFIESKKSTDVDNILLNYTKTIKV